MKLKKIRKVLCVVIFVFLIAWNLIILISFVKNSEYMKILKSDFSDSDRTVLAEEFDVEYISDKIIKSSYSDGYIRIQIGEFDSVEDAVNSVEFIDSESKINCLKNLRNEFYNYNYSTKYNNIDGEELETYYIDGMKTNASHCWIYKKDFEFYIEIEKIGFKSSDSKAKAIFFDD